jgi:aminoglycoside phosphotransferase (APT) family kinase protein
MSNPPLAAALARLGLLADGQDVPMQPLAGGVSSDIWRVDLPSGPVCVKRALPRLKVAQVWEAPVERNRYEHDYLRVVAGIAPDAVPRLVAHDAAAGLFVMGYLDPAVYPVWKEQLRQGIVNLAFAAAVGTTLASIHAATADRADLAAAFATDAIFRAIRLEPYLLATARVHADVAPRLAALADATARTKLALVHGDVSPKNILAGPRGPVLLDAECAWYGDPAFDLAFCLNHLLLKCAWVPRHTARFLDGYAALSDAYLAGVTWEPAARIEARTAALLPGLLLARVDGKSPVEYLHDEAAKDRIRATARRRLQTPRARLLDIAADWRMEIER